MSVLEPSEWRQLKVFAWFLLIINACILGIGALFARALELTRGGWFLVGAVALLVNATFLIIVGGNLLYAFIAHRRREKGRRPPG